MRMMMMTLAAAGAALAAASPAVAQYYPQPAYGYGNPGYGYGQYGQGNWGQTRALQARIDMVQREIRNLRDRRMISRREYDGLRSESRGLEARLRSAAAYGLDGREARGIEYRIARLESRVRYEVADGRRNGSTGYGRNGYNNGYGYTGAYYVDRDRDGDNDQHERWQDDHDD